MNTTIAGHFPSCPEVRIDPKAAFGSILDEPRRGMRRICRCVSGAHWRRTFDVTQPMLVVVRSGFVVVRRDGATTLINRGETALLTPGYFELEATPAMRHGSIDVEYGEIPMAHLSKMLLHAPVTERLILGVPEKFDRGVYVQRGMVSRLDAMFDALPEQSRTIEAMATTVLTSLQASTFPFMKFAFFERRWALLALMEAKVIRRFPASFIAARYATGRAAFFRDCQTFLGRRPEKWFRQRRMELARIWIQHSGTSSKAVASVLGYRKCKEFRAAYRRYHGRTVEESSNSRPWAGLDSRTKASCMRPFWWPAPLPLLDADGEPFYPEEAVDDRQRKEDERQPHDDEDAAKTEQIAEAFSDDFFALKPEAVAKIIPFPPELPGLLMAA